VEEIMPNASTMAAKLIGRWAILVMLLALALPAEAARTTLRATRPGGSTLELRAASTGEAWVIEVREGRAIRQRIEAETDLPNTLPFLVDANGDGAADLWVPVMVGSANGVYALWLMEPARARFRRAGEIGGVLHVSRDAAGRLIALGRGSCCSMGYTFHDFTPQGDLRTLFTVERGLRDDSGTGRPIPFCEADVVTIAPPPDEVAALCRRELRSEQEGMPGPETLPGTLLGPWRR
jgi:hypothetical protein